MSAKKFKVTLAVDVPSYAAVEVEAATEEAAYEIVTADIEANGWESRFFAAAEGWDDDWTNAENLRVV